MNSKLKRKRVSITEANIGLISNCQELLEWKKGTIADINTDFLIVEPKDGRKNDAEFHILNENKSPTINIVENVLFARGDFKTMEQETSDLRFSLLGNEGLFFRFVLKVLEEKCGIFNFHACSLVDENTERLFIICGGAGSGKTAFLLAGIEKGLKVFATEMTHFNFRKKELIFFKGSLLDNVRLGSLKYDFQKAREMLNVELPEVEDEWGTKLVVDLSPYQTSSPQLKNPRITLVIPHIEKDMKESVVIPVENKRFLCKSLFDSASEKIGGTFLLYEKMPILGLDSLSASKKRLNAVNKLMVYEKLDKAVRIISGAKNCLEGVKG